MDECKILPRGLRRSSVPSVSPAATATATAAAAAAAAATTAATAAAAAKARTGRVCHAQPPRAQPLRLPFRLIAHVRRGVAVQVEIKSKM